MNMYKEMESKRKHVRHWLHIILTLITMGLWVPVWVIVAVRAASFNRDLDVRMSGAFEAMSSGRERM